MTALITALPSPPSRQDPTNFAAKGDALLGALPTFVTEANAMSTEFNTLYSNAMAAGLANAATNATNAANSATAAAASATSANNSFLSMDKKWLGAKSSNPTVDNQGAALATGAAYFNTTAGETRVWSGTAWVSASVIGGTVASLNVTGNTVLGDASTDTVQVNGYIGVGVVPASTIGLYVAPTGLTSSAQYGVRSQPIGNSAATSLIVGFQSLPQTAAAAFTVADLIGYRAIDAVKGAGSTITNQHGLYISDLAQGANNYGITSLVSAGTNKRNLNIQGTADNYIGGNLASGIAPNSWASTAKAIEIANGAAVFSISTNAYFGANYYYDGAYKYKATGRAYNFVQDANGMSWNIAPSGTAGSAISFTQVQTLMVNGNRLLGTATDGAAKDRVEVGSQTYLYEGLNAGTAVYRVLANGNVQNTNNSYGAISDAKLKDVVGPKPSTWDKTKQYNWVEYYLKTDTEKKHKLLGLVAQEAELVSPGVVFQNTDLEEVEIVEQVTQEVPVTETQTVDQTITEPQLIEGRWTEVTTTKPVEQTVQLYDEFPLFDENGDPILEKVDDKWVQKMHRVPRTTTVTESVSRKEMQPTGTITKGVKYSVVAMEYFRAFQEAQQRIETAENQISDLLNRVAALESA
ncbi:MAG TPA: tail fiber domain-containing protein [Limnobacter sp.]|uniref:tail fiber domain-containing protein n=1 Tax=Limnobacter sp. TaxID=2003368 RepID=UPI002E30FB64|nr:tail fiber domain-containing protein [Limnobacter sp.]HEX5486493.1 tail fiber domain-containing protein [Limnobacter sp.]